MIGVIADDLTGATDAASAMRRRGIRVALTFGVPTSASLSRLVDVDVVIAALKIRSVDVAVALAATTATSAVFASHGIELVYFKYCSTFDSTPTGNIGPVSDAMMDLCGKDIFLHVPGYPENGRTVCHGYLFVGDVLLNESSMRDHPLNPMLDSNLSRLLSPQTSTATTTLPYHRIRTGSHAASSLKSLGRPAHVLCDTLDDNDIDALSLIATHDGLASRTLAGGGAPMAAALCSTMLGLPRGSGEASAEDTHDTNPSIDGYRVAIAGSASAMTVRQIDAFDGSTLRLAPSDLADPNIDQRVHEWAQQHWETDPVLVTSNGGDRAALDDSDAPVVEAGLAAIARRLVDAGAKQIVVAGGETSGAVAAGLGISTVVVGDEICTGVPWTYALEPQVSIAFKSGNFGSDDFFRTAFNALMACAV